MELDFRPEKDERLITREEDVGLLIFDPNTGEIKVLNETAATIWNNIDGKNSIQDIINIVAEQNLDEDKNVIELDVLRFMNELQENTFIRE